MHEKGQPQPVFYPGLLWHHPLLFLLSARRVFAGYVSPYPPKGDPFSDFESATGERGKNTPFFQPCQVRG